MASNRHENVAPSLAKVYEMKQRLTHAKNAAQLLRRKARVFDLLLRDHSRDLIKNTELMIEILREAFITLAAAKYSNGDFLALVEESVDKEAQVKVTMNIERSLAGARVYTMVVEDAGPNVWPLAGLSTGGRQITECKKTFFKALQILVNQVTLRSVIKALHDSRVSTMRKSMVIDHVTVPNIDNTIAYITDQLDDMEREDMYRLKKIKQKILVKQKMIRAARQKEEEDREPEQCIENETTVPLLTKLPEIQLTEDRIAIILISEEIEEPTHLDKEVQVSAESLAIHICGKKSRVARTPCVCSAEVIKENQPVKVDECVQATVKPTCCSKERDFQEDDIKPIATEDVATQVKRHKKKGCACQKK